MERNSFYCKDGKLAFFIPFTFSNKNSFWSNCFNEANLQDNTSKQNRKDAYIEGKNTVIELLKTKDENLFNNAKACLEICPKGRRYDGGKNLCSCISINNKFHDDASQKALRTKLFLGDYNVIYEYSNNKFSFDLNVYLAINREDNICFLILKTGLESFKDDGIFEGSGDDYLSNAIIFWKHIFYKERLKVKINGGVPESLRKWTTRYIKTIHSALGIDIALNFKSEDEEISFSYSIIELDNIQEKKDGEIISLKDFEDFMQKYSHQLYGLLVSDEGWKDVPDNYISNKFKDRYHSSRDYLYSFFIGHNALVINQLGAPSCNTSKNFGKEWFKKYTQEGNEFVYSEYFDINPCIPGLQNHLLLIFMKSIYKNIMLERTLNNTKKETSIKELENRIEKLTEILESHSVLLGETQNIKDCIHKEFGLNEKLQKIKDSYIHKTNSLNSKNDKEQNSKIGKLTHITIALAILSLIFSLTYPDPYKFLWLTKKYVPWIATIVLLYALYNLPDIKITFIMLKNFIRSIKLKK